MLKYLWPLRNDPVISLLTFEDPEVNSFDELFELSENSSSPKTAAHLMHAILKAQVKPSFHKINVHAAMTPAEIKGHFAPVLEQAELLHDMYQQVQKRVASCSSLVISSQTTIKSLETNRHSSSKSAVVKLPDINLNDSNAAVPSKTPFVTVSSD